MCVEYILNFICIFINIYIHSILVYSCIMLYRKLIKTGKIKINGAAARRLKVLEDRYDGGDKIFKSS